MSTPTTKSLIVTRPVVVAVQPTKKSKATKPKNGQKTVKAMQKLSIVKAPAAIAYASKTQRAKIVNSAEGCTVTHSEQFAKVEGSLTEGSATNLQINPQNATMFPWLAGIAANYEEYRFKKLKFSFRPFVATSAPGVITAAIDYDASDVPPTSRQQLLSYQGAVNGNIWRQIDLVSTGKPEMLKFRYCVPGGLPPTNTDIKMYNLGSLQAWTAACQYSSIVGEWFVDYTCEFRKAQIQDIGSRLVPVSLQVSSNGTVTNANPLGNNPLIRGAVATLVAGLSNTALTFTKPGSYLLDWLTNGTTMGGGGATVTASDSNITINDIGGASGGPSTQNTSLLVTVSQAALAAGSQLLLSFIPQAGSAVTGGRLSLAPSPWSTF